MQIAHQEKRMTKLQLQKLGTSENKGISQHIITK